MHQLPAHAAAPEGLVRDATTRTGSSIVGVHTPEFAFEHVPSNVRAAVQAGSASRYPVALDNDYGTWNAYRNQYWPAEYLIDRTRPRPPLRTSARATYDDDGGARSARCSARTPDAAASRRARRPDADGAA